MATEGTDPPEEKKTPPVTEEPAKAKPEDEKPLNEDPRFNERMAQAKRSERAALLKELGVESVDTGKAAIAKAKELEESQKSEIQKFADKVNTLEPVAQKAVDLEAKLVRYADAEMAKLTDAQKAAVGAIAGDDKGKVLDVIEALRPTWTVETKADPKTEKLPAAANTSAAGGAPPSSGTTATVDHKATYEALKKEHPMKAAQYLAQFSTEIYK